MIDLGVGITFAPTRDKSALAVVILDNGTTVKAYASDVAELEVIIETLLLQAQALE